MIDDEDALVELLDRFNAPAEVREHTLKAARMGRQTKRQHYVPAGYLKAWADADGHVGVWDTIEGKTFKAGPDKVCAESDFYTVRLVDGTPTRLMEGFLAALDGQFISRVRKTVSTEEVPRDLEERYWLAFDIALNENRLPQRRRLMSAMADRISKMEVSDKLIDAGIDPEDYEVAVTTEFHSGQMMEMASKIAPILVEAEWTLHVSDHPVFATCDVPVLFDYERSLSPDEMFKSAAGRQSLATAWTAGLSPDRLHAGIATAAEVLVPLSPKVLLRINPYGTPGGGSKTNRNAAVRKRLNRLIVRCRERMVVAVPGHELVTSPRPAVPRRRQLLVECISSEETEDGGSCVLRTAFTYAAEAQLQLCGNHF